jgi:radical SAM superfamily enzyme YgiQ (UPF0313 family)
MEIILFTECNGSPGWGRDAGCYMIASQLRKSGFSVQTIDFFSFMTELKMKSVIENFFTQDTLAVGFSSTHFSSYLPKDFDEWMSSAKRTEKNNAWNTYFPFTTEQMQSFIQQMKKKAPKLKVIVGGQKVAQKRKLQEHYPFVDYWIEGMADKSIVTICEDLKKGIYPSVKRLSSEKDYPPFQEFSESSILWKKNDYLFEHEALPLEIARGCPFACSFCDYKKKRFGEFIKKPEFLEKELLRNYELFGITHYMITDFLVNESLEKTEMVHDVFSKLPFKIEWSGFARLDLLEKFPKMIDLLAESGAKSIMWGIESIRKDVSGYVGKVCDQERIEKLLSKMKSAWGDSIITGSGFIIGLPKETDQSARAQLDWIIDSGRFLHGYEVTPLFIGAYTPSKSATIDYSKIQKDPKQFGYTLEMRAGANGFSEDWIINETGFTKSKAISMIEEYQNKKKWIDGRLIGTYHNYSRFRNLGLTHEEILQSCSGNVNFIKQSRTNYYEKADRYFSNFI